MPKKHEKNSDEFYKGIIRELKAEVRKLKQELKYFQRHEHYHETVKEFEPPALVEYFQPCPSCGKGKLIEMIIAGRYFFSCDVCAFRTKTRYLNESKNKE